MCSCSTSVTARRVSRSSCSTLAAPPTSARRTRSRSGVSSPRSPRTSGATRSFRRSSASSTRASSGVTAAADWLPHHGFFVDAPASAVWPLILDWTLWCDDKRLDHVSGEHGRVGEVQRLSTLSDNGAVASSVLIETARIIPETRLAYRLLAPDAEAPSRSDGYAIFHLYPVGERTLV